MDLSARGAPVWVSCSGIQAGGPGLRLTAGEKRSWGPAASGAQAIQAGAVLNPCLARHRSDPSGKAAPVHKPPLHGRPGEVPGRKTPENSLRGVGTRLESMCKTSKPS